MMRKQAVTQMTEFRQESVTFGRIWTGFPACGPVARPPSAILSAEAQKPLESGGRSAYLPLAQLSHVPVVACRPVGLRTRGRGDAQVDPERATRSPGISRKGRQPESETGELRLRGGRDLKQRRSGLFWSLPALHRPGSLKRHYILAGRADRVPPFQAKAALTNNASALSVRLSPAKAAGFIRQIGSPSAFRPRP